MAGTPGSYDPSLDGGTYYGNNGNTYRGLNDSKAQMEAKAPPGTEVFYNENAGGWNLRAAPGSGSGGGGGAPKPPKPKPKTPPGPTNKPPTPGGGGPTPTGPTPPPAPPGAPAPPPTAPGAAAGTNGPMGTGSHGVGLSEGDDSAAATIASLAGMNNLREGIGQRRYPDITKKLGKRIY